MRLLLDEHISREIARRLVRSGHVAVRVVDAGLRGLSDSELLLWAKGEGRILISRDTDFLNDIQHPPEASAGIIILRLTDESSRAAFAALEHVLGRLEDETLAGRLVVIGDGSLMRIWPEE